MCSQISFFALPHQINFFSIREKFVWGKCLKVPEGAPGQKNGPPVKTVPPEKNAKCKHYKL